MIFVVVSLVLIISMDESVTSVRVEDRSLIFGIILFISYPS